MVSPCARIVRIIGNLPIFCFLVVGSSPIVLNEPTLSLRLVDVETNSSPIPILFLKKKTAVIVESLDRLAKNEAARKIDNSFVHKTSDKSFLIYSTFVNEHQVANGTIDLSENWKRNSTFGVPSSIDAGVIEVETSGHNIIRVELYSVLSGNVIESSATIKVRSYQRWIAGIPIIIGFGLFLVFNVHIVHSLFCAMFIGSCIIEGSVINGFRTVLDTYILEAATDTAHVFIIFFITAISVLMSMVKASGGTAAVVKAVRRHSSKTRVAQLTIFGMGLACYFDPYVSIMVVGKVFGSLKGGLPLSVEKFSFLIHATATPVSSIIPKSTWMSFVGDLMQTEINKMLASGSENISNLNGQSLALSTVTFQFYPCLVVGFVLLQIFTRREIGLILKAENQARFNFLTIRRDGEWDANIRRRKWNWYIPVFTLIVFLWSAFARIDIDGQSRDLPSLASAWLTSTVATIILAQFIFMLQQKNGNIPLLDYFLEQRGRNRFSYLTNNISSASSTVSIPFNLSSKSEDSDGLLRENPNYHLQILKMEKGTKENKTERNDLIRCLKAHEPLLSLNEGVTCMMEGIQSSIPVTLSLVFAWATASVYTSLGVDRVILSWILDDNLSVRALPLVIFLNAFLLSIITGSSWSCVSTLIPGTMSHLVEVQGDDSDFLILVLASLLSGAVAGEHIGPFSETSILSALISQSEVRQHFLTQLPYASFILILSVLVGTVPTSYDNYPSYVGHILGIAVVAAFIMLVCRQVERHQSSIPGQIRDEPITQSLHSLVTRKKILARKENIAIDSKSGVSFERESTELNLEDVSIVDASTMHQGTEVVAKIGNRMQNKNIVHRGVHDPIDRENRKKRLIEATIKKAEEDGNVFSDSLRLFLRTAEQKLGNILENNKDKEMNRSASADSTGDDSLDNLMMNIASRGWKEGINNLLDEGHENSTRGGDYTTDGGSTLLATEDSATATSHTLGDNGQSTYFTEHDQSTYFTGHDQSTYFNEAASYASSATEPSEYRDVSSHLLRPLNFNVSRKQALQYRMDEEGGFLSHTDDIFSAAENTQASF